MIKRVDKDYGHPPIYVTENGCSYPTAPGADGRVHDDERIEFYNGYVGQVGRAIDEGCDVRGYYAWTLLDNFEWAVGTASASASCTSTSRRRSAPSRTAATGSAT